MKRKQKKRRKKIRSEQKQLKLLAIIARYAIRFSEVKRLRKKKVKIETNASLIDRRTFQRLFSKIKE